MALAVDPSTPALVTDTTSATTASFTAPANSFLVVLGAIGDNSTITVSNTGAALTWTERVAHTSAEDAGAYTATAYLATAPALASEARTVTLEASSGGVVVGLKVLVVTGIDFDTPVGATGEGHSATTNLTAAAYTSTVAESLAVGVAVDNSEAGVDPTSSDVGFGFSSGFAQSGIAVYKAAVTANDGTSVTLNFNGTGSSREWNWVAAELIPLPEPVRFRGVVSTSARHRAASW